MPSEGDDGLELIPGIGVIRVRVLRKAGYGTLRALRGVTPEQLAAIAGITEIKAHQIAAFVAAWSNASRAPAPRPAAQRSIQTFDWHIALERLGGAADAALRAPDAARFRPALARQIARISLLCSQPHETSPADGWAAEVERLERMLHRLDGAVPDKKGQNALADRLRDTRRRLSHMLETGADA
ncbi:MAG: hypothetical protein KGJ62_09000 [Armatimonadetes bacterium]|nr:hypothetical protein [Armatimonadota bacterium]MDE2206444.1 hypothetical protein [Armatimonadota bacterium]